MEVKFDIPDDKVKNFSSNAKSKIVQHAQGYVIDIISEAERIELSLHEGDSPSEVTSSHVGHAANKFRSISSVKKRKIGIKILRFISDFLILVTGLMFLPEKFVVENTFNVSYFIIFLLVLTSALITAGISQFGGGD